MSGDPAEKTPWITGSLTIPRALLEEIHAHARAEYPSECCGLIAGPRQPTGALDQALPEVNEADKYHRLDPEHFPRTSKTYFKINELRAAKAFDRGEASDRPIKVIYHSHCDAGSYFSPEDAATFARQGQLMWPCAFLVVSVIAGEVRSQQLWSHVPGTDTFEESTLEIDG
jgi:proteasome lid subunit RPN8/RPN11